MKRNQKKSNEQAWKLSAIKGEPNLSILWEVRQIHLKKTFSSQKATSNLTKLFLDEKQFLPKNCFWPLKVWSSLIFFWQIWSQKIKNKTVTSTLSVNVTTFYINIFWFVRNPIWSSLIKLDPFWTYLIHKNSKSNWHF